MSSIPSTQRRGAGEAEPRGRLCAGTVSYTGCDRVISRWTGLPACASPVALVRGRMLKGVGGQTPGLPAVITQALALERDTAGQMGGVLRQPVDLGANAERWE